MKKIISLFLFFSLCFSSFAEWVIIPVSSISPWAYWSTDEANPIDGMKIKFGNEGLAFLISLNSVQLGDVAVPPNTETSIMFNEPLFGTFALNVYPGGCYATVWAHYPDASYTLTVNGGITSGSFAPGTNCPISPTIPQGQTFTGWTATDCTLNSAASIASNSITMSSVDCSVTANFSSGHVLTVVGGTGSGTYEYGVDVTITATPSAGSHFVRWSDATYLHGQINSAKTSILDMPDSDYTITAETADGEGAGDGYHVWVDNFSELSAIVTAPIVAELSSINQNISTVAANTNLILTSLNQIRDKVLEESTASSTITPPGVTAIDPVDMPVLPELTDNTVITPGENDMNPGFMTNVKDKMLELKSSSTSNYTDFVIPLSKISPLMTDITFNFSGSGSVSSDVPGISTLFNDLRVMCRDFMTVVLWVLGIFQWVRIVMSVFTII